MHRYFIKLAYKGTHYHGWQIQDNAHTVQAELNQKISLMLGETVNLVGCGRTDTGVHAMEFYAHFDISKELDQLDHLAYKLNGFLPEDIVVFEIFEVPTDFHARFDAQSRTYKYDISQRKNPFAMGQTFYYHGQLDVVKMNAACEILYEYTDFTSFSKLHTQTKTNHCTIYKAKWEKVGDELVFTIQADRFLRNMVRAIVGTMLEIGSGKLQVDELHRIIEAKDRSDAGFSVPAEGLFLEKVVYDFPKKPQIKP
ncbi:MAG: tRNA pseudouridine(38-40) synthase TruA [Marinilabiliales bacterium]|nr:MAG: tRNA pseudouridine(38-40) synthase TruA [Marinilabiliales bacterium]